jgi:hypothetical protein
MNDIVINWDRLSKALPPQKHYADDRGPTIEELKRILSYPDKRIKPIILTMLSSGIRLGAWDYLRVKDVSPIQNKKTGDIIAGKIVVYAGEHDQYTSLITPESWFSIEEWVNYRKQHGETIGPQSMLLRDIWQTSEHSYGAYFGLAKNPKKLKLGGIKSLIERAIRSQGLLTENNDLPELDDDISTKKVRGRKMRPWKSIHGIRKTYKLIAEQKMKPANIELLLGHKLGISSSYYKPNLERDILPDFLQIIDDLTINDEYRLTRKVKELIEKNQDKEYIIKAKLDEKNEQIKDMQNQILMLTESQKEILEILKYPNKLQEISNTL